MKQALALILAFFLAHGHSLSQTHEDTVLFSELTRATTPFDSSNRAELDKQEDFFLNLYLDNSRITLHHDEAPFLDLAQAVVDRLRLFATRIKDPKPRLEDPLLAEIARIPKIPKFFPYSAFSRTDSVRKVVQKINRLSQFQQVFYYLRLADEASVNEFHHKRFDEQIQHVIDAVNSPRDKISLYLTVAQYYQYDRLVPAFLAYTNVLKSCFELGDYDLAARIQREVGDMFSARQFTAYQLRGLDYYDYSIKSALGQGDSLIASIGLLKYAEQCVQTNKYANTEAYLKALQYAKVAFDYISNSNYTNYYLNAHFTHFLSIYFGSIAEQQDSTLRLASLRYNLVSMLWQLQGEQVPNHVLFIKTLDQIARLSAQTHELQLAIPMADAAILYTRAFSSSNNVLSITLNKANYLSIVGEHEAASKLVDSVLGSQAVDSLPGSQYDEIVKWAYTVKRYICERTEKWDSATYYSRLVEDFNVGLVDEIDTLTSIHQGLLDEINRGIINRQDSTIRNNYYKIQQNERFIYSLEKRIKGASDSLLQSRSEIFQNRKVNEQLTQNNLNLDSNNRGLKHSKKETEQLLNEVKNQLRWAWASVGAAILSGIIGLGVVIILQRIRLKGTKQQKDYDARSRLHTGRSIFVSFANMLHKGHIEQATKFGLAGSVYFDREFQRFDFDENWTLQMELELLDAYGTVLRIKDKNVNISAHVDEPFEPSKIRFLSGIFTVLLENTLSRGFADSDSNQKKFEVKISKKGKYLKAIVSDNGAPSERTAYFPRERRHSGLKLLRQRIRVINRLYRMLSFHRGSFTIDPVVGKGTTTSFLVPYETI